MATEKTSAIQKKNEMQEYSLTSANSILKMADELAKFIKDRKLTQNIKGKDFVLVEAWTFAGMSMGLMPIPVKVTNISTSEEIKYEAVVELLNIHTNTVVGRGFAICSNKESGKKYFEEYAIASMAQTRATSKAYRLPLGFLMKAAGYEATPAEEMDFQTAEVVENKPAQAKAEPVQQTQPEPAAAEFKEALLKNLEAFRSVFFINENEKIKSAINSLTAEKAEETRKKLNSEILSRLKKDRANLSHQASPEQLDLIDKNLLSRVFTIDEKAGYNTANFEYDTTDASERIEFLLNALKDRKQAATA